MAFRHLRLRPFILRILYTVLHLIQQMLIIMKIIVFDLSAGSEQFFLPWGDHIRRQYSGILTFRNSGIPKFRNSDFPKFQIFEIPTFRNSDFPEFRLSEIPTFRNSDFPKFRLFEIPQFRLSGSRNSGILISIPECSGILNTPNLTKHSTALCRGGGPVLAQFLPPLPPF